MVEVFKTNVYSKATATKLLASLAGIFPDFNMNFDLEDCDKIFRVHAAEAPVCAEEIMLAFNNNGYRCEVLD